MNAEDVAQLYFQKAESTRTSSLNYDANTRVGLLFTIASILLTSTFWDIVSQWYGAIGAIILFTIVFRTIAKNRRYFKLKYEEYKTEYVKFYAVPYIKDHIQKSTTRSINVNEISAIANKMHDDTNFDVEFIKTCIILYCDEHFQKVN